MLVHGFGADLNAWMFNQSALAERHRVVALDLPGHGGSVKQVGSGDAETFCSAVSDALAALGIERFHLVGHSMGGAIALVLAGQMPRRIASLTLLAPAGLGPEINGAFIDGFVKVQRRREAQELLAALVHDPSLISRAMVEETLRYKRLDGVPAALDTIARAWFPDGSRPSTCARRWPRSRGRCSPYHTSSGVATIASSRSRMPRRFPAAARPYSRRGRAHSADGKSGGRQPADRSLCRGKPLMQTTAKPTVLGLAADLAAGRTSSRALVERVLARIADPAGRRRAHLHQGLRR